jgi:hypothetical protein
VIAKFVFTAFTLVYLLPLTVSAQILNDDIVVKKLRTHQDVVDQYCLVATGGGKYVDCGSYYTEDKLDVIYVPEVFAQRILNHLKSAYSKNYFQNMSKVDLFHGHFLAKGPQTYYASPADWLNDVEMVLYHSAEYLQGVWTSLDKNSDLYHEHDVERSFAGWTKGDVLGVEAAINLIVPGSQIKSYANAGTIYAEELNASLHISQHNLSNFGGNEKWMLNTCGPNEKDCEPCEIFNMMYMMEMPNGRFLSPDGKRIDIFFHCKYRKL